jgi:AAA+ ATPase superfamily predicted ATPase
MDLSFLEEDHSPFAFGRVAVGDTFVNRMDEKKRLALNFANKVNTILISPRRWGKSSLVKEVGTAMNKAHKQYRFAYIDLFSIRTESEFYEAYAREVIKCSSNKFDEWVNNARLFLKNVTPKISISGDAQHDFDLSFDVKDIKKSYDTILNLPEKIAKEKNIKIVICIDEFQNIASFTDNLAFQKRLRSFWQQHQNVTYCLYGSKRSLLIQLFEKRSMPFYRFGDIMYLEKIAAKHWNPFILNAFAKTRKKIKQEQITRIIDLMQCHPYYIQQLCYLLWIRSGRTVKDEDLVASIEDLVNQNSNLFEREAEGMSNSKIAVIRAIANGNYSGLSSGEIIREYHLGSSANVTKTLKALDLDEIIDKRNGEYRLIDPSFELWFKKRFQGKKIV